MAYLRRGHEHQVFGLYAVTFHEVFARIEHRKCPFEPYYGGLSPRVAVAWNPKVDSGILSKLFPSGKTVIRAGYGRALNRINGINQVKVTLQGAGIGQAVTCIGVQQQRTVSRDAAGRHRDG